MERLNSGDEKIIFGTNLRILDNGLMKCGRLKWQEAEVTRKDFNIVLTRQDKKFFISELFKVIQDAISLILITGQCINSEQFLRVHLSHRMCNQFTLHHEFRIDTGRTKFEQKTDGILHVCGSRDPNNIDLEAPRLAQYMHKAWKKHQNTVYWVDIEFA